MRKVQITVSKGADRAGGESAQGAAGPVTSRLTGTGTSALAWRA